MHVTKTLIGVLDYGLPLDQAIALPNIYFGDGQLEVEQDTSLAAIAGQISAFGQKVRTEDLGSKVNGAQYLNGSWTGAADPRSEGVSATIDAKGKITTTRPVGAADVPLPSVG
jgi:gamma-glutamyltranspeptidase/glutathione hydrolase